ncbi:MAG: hypothetical protein HYX55_03725 [Chloroflexi bacterium]|nr:hypothetical protein [Chloroflexota bacterium]
MSAPAIVGKSPIHPMADVTGIARRGAASTTADPGPNHVAFLLRDTSMRVLEGALALGALATALILGIGR